MGINYQSDDPASIVTSLIEESDSARRTRQDQWKNSIDYYRGDQRPGNINNDEIYHVVNHTRTAVNGMLSVMTQESPETDIVPLEKDVRGIIYIKPEMGPILLNSVRAMREGLDNGSLVIEGDILDQEADERIPRVSKIAVNVLDSFEPGVYLGEKPILPNQFDILRDSDNPMTGVPFLSEEDVVEVNDVTTADFAKRLLRGIWQHKNWDQKIAGYQLDAIVIGHRDVIIDYDDDKDEIDTSKALELDTWIDPNPNVDDIPDAGYFTYAQAIDMETAVKMFPSQEELLRRNPMRPDSETTSGSRLSHSYKNVDWRRDMAVIYTTWIRDQKMTRSIKRMKSKNEGEPDTVKEEKFKKPKFGLREIRTINSMTLFDGPSRYDDIPVARFKFLKEVNSSYSVGLASMIKGLQDSFNRTFTNISQHARYLAFPILWGESEMVDKLYESMRDAFLNFKDIVKVDMSMLEKEMKDPINIIDTPSLNPSHISFLSLTLSLINDLTSQSDVVRGVASSKAESGRAIEALQAGANRTLTLASKIFDQAIRGIQKHALWTASNFMPIEKVMKYVEKYPQPVVELMLKRLKDMQYDVVVRTSGTKRVDEASRQQKAILMRQANAMSLETFLKEMGVDNPEEEARKIIGEQVAVAKANLDAELQQKQFDTESKVLIENTKSKGDLEKTIVEQDKETERALMVEEIRRRAISSSDEIRAAVELKKAIESRKSQEKKDDSSKSES